MHDRARGPRRLLDGDEEPSRLARIRQELLARVGAIIGYQEILGEKAGRLGLEALVPDLERVHEASLRLRTLVDQPLEASNASPPGFGARLRHDLRTPLNAIMGYGELMLEELGAHGRGAAAA